MLKIKERYKTLNLGYLTFAISCCNFGSSYKEVAQRFSINDCLHKLYTMSNPKARVTVSQKVNEVLSLADKVYRKHVAEGGNSPLKTLADFNWDTIGPGIEAIKALHEESETLKRRSEELVKERNMRLSELKDSLRSSKNLLKSVYSKNPKRMGEWGFDVIDSPKSKHADK